MQRFSLAFDTLCAWVKTHFYPAKPDDDYDPYAYPDPEPPQHFRIVDSVVPRVRYHS